eukprot:scaffold2514_cov373-Prasinococcus_capsulatus_cf.AAC.7
MRAQGSHQPAAHPRHAERPGAADCVGRREPSPRLVPPPLRSASLQLPWLTESRSECQLTVGGG